jgi:hypothetical protein
MAVGNLLMKRAANGRETFARNHSTQIDARVLAPSVNQTHDVPSGATIVIFSCDQNFYAKAGGAAAVPGAAVTDGSASELNPTIWSLDGVTQIGLISPTNAVVTLSFYKGNS